MENFTYYTPTKVVFGKGTENQTGALVKEQHCKKVLIHYGSGSVVRSGLLDRIKTSLDEAAVSYVELGGVVPNPRLSLVYEGIELCKKENVDFISTEEYLKFFLPKLNKREINSLIKNIKIYLVIIEKKII